MKKKEIVSKLIQHHPEMVIKGSSDKAYFECGELECYFCPAKNTSCYDWLNDAVNDHVASNIVDETPNLFRSMSNVDLAPDYNSDPMIHDNAKAKLDALPDSDITVADNGWEKETLKDGKVKTMYQLFDPYFHEGVCKILTLGAQKYKPNNWVDGSHDEYSRAVESHWIEYKKGNKLDKESGKSHLYHIACNLMFLDYFDRKEEELEEIKAEVHENVQKTYMKG